MGMALTRTWLGIRNVGSGKNHVFSITPTTAMGSTSSDSPFGQPHRVRVFAFVYPGATGRLKCQRRPSSSVFFSANSSSVRIPASRSDASFAICSTTSG